MSASAPIARYHVPPFPALTRSTLETLQVNLGYRCNQACAHCHVDAGPTRTEEMSAQTIAVVLQYLQHARPHTLDITGGAPELNPHFRALVRDAGALGLKIIDRCNLTILAEPGQADLAEFLAENQVRVVASLPCYGPQNVDAQRGRGVFGKSIRGLRELNALGYGRAGSALVLDLVYNPVGAHLPPAQQSLEAIYKARLFEDHGVQFNQLLTIANMPIARFRHALEREHRLDNYLQLLVDNYAAENLTNVMCRSLLSVDWQGNVFDCDFNQMLRLEFANRQPTTHLSELLETTVAGLPITVRDHCYGCTAGQGSGCSGALHA
ncbi:MAG: radical SAM/Cys-rich domain protein [Gammaproteobacteria bacterium]|nr:radical SAM/Cys-rich domain protein [Gammaproteobacteria bacterium]